MKKLVATLILIAAVQGAFANDAEIFVDKKTNLDAEFSNMSCNDLKQGLPKLEKNIDAIKYLSPGTVQYDIAIYVIKLTLEKASKCI